MQILHKRLALRFAYTPTLLRQAAADLLFDAIERTDPAQRLLGDRRLGGLEDLKMLAPRVRPACGFQQRVAGSVVQAVESGVAIGLQNAAEILQVLTRMFTLAIRRVAQQHCGWIGAARGPIIAHVRP